MRRRRRRLLGPVVALFLVLVAGGSGAASLPVVKGTDNVPVLATFEIHQYGRNTYPMARGAIHGVRRVHGATVLYWSLGYPEGSKSSEPVQFVRTQPIMLGQRWNALQSYAAPGLADPVGRKAYSTLVTEEGGRCLCTQREGVENRAGRAIVFHNVYPALPAELQSVSVTVGFDTVVAGLPVEDGPLLPAVDPAEPIHLGDGWPRIDAAAVTAAPDKDLSVHTIESRVKDLAAQVTTVEAPSQVSLELSADVLFALDSAELTPRAQAALAKVAATVNERAKAGELSVVGHTDDSGTDAYNDELSKRRAEAVHAALAPLVEVAGLTYRVEGRGEREPVAENSTDEGRQANRRVTVSFAPGS